MKLTLLISVLPLIAGCSAYQSQSRKRLEQSALTLSKEANGAYVSCSTQSSTNTWVVFEKNERAQLSTTENNSFDLQVTPTTPTEYSCYFRFTSAQEMFENTSPAIDVCLHQSPADCQGEFAFR